MQTKTKQRSSFTPTRIFKCDMYYTVHLMLDFVLPVINKRAFFLKKQSNSIYSTLKNINQLW